MGILFWVIVDIIEILSLLWDALSFCLIFLFEELIVFALFCYQFVFVPQLHFVFYQ
jgi:hypothetical protein